MEARAGRGLLPWLAGIWLFGTAACLAILLLARWSLWRLCRNSRVVDHGPRTTLVKETAGRLRLQRPVRLLTSPRRPLPMVWGVFRPKVLLPEPCCEWPEQRWHAVLLHELAHVKRGDCLTKLIAQFVCALHWFNPLAWIAAKRIDVEAERACDDMVIRSGTSPRDYAAEILEIATAADGGGLASHAAIAMARRSRLEGRLLAILDRRRVRRPLTLRTALAAAVFAASVAGVFGSLRAAMQPAAPPVDRAVEQPDEALHDAKRPDRRSAERARVLKEHADKLTLEIRYRPAKGESAPGLAMSLYAPAVDYYVISQRPPGLKISEAEARKIVDHLAADGFLGRAQAIPRSGPLPVPKGPTLTLRLDAPEVRMMLFEDLGWSPAAADRVAGLKDYLDQHVARLVDKLFLSPLESRHNFWKTPTEETAASDELQQEWQLDRQRGLLLRHDDKGRVVEAGFTDPVSEAALQYLKQLPHLQSLICPNMAAKVRYDVTDDKLEHISALKGLRKLDLQGSKVTDAGTGQLKGLKNLEFLSLARTQVGDAGLLRLQGFGWDPLAGDIPLLKTVILDRTQVTDAGLKELTRYRLLETLSLEGTRVGDTGVAHLTTLVGLKSLNLRRTQVTDAGLEPLRRLARLKHLDVSQTRVTDAGVAWMGRLKSLSLAGTNITDEAVKNLAAVTLRLTRRMGHPELEELDLSGTQVTDAAIEDLSFLAKLTHLNLEQTRVSPEGIRRLQEALPNARILPSAAAAADAPSAPDIKTNSSRTGPNKSDDEQAVAALRQLRATLTRDGNGQVTEVTFGWAPLTDAALEHLRGLPSLHSVRRFRLKMEAAAVTDAGLAHLAGLSNLKVLELPATKVTGVGLEHLKGLTNLEVLCFDDTEVADDGLAHVDGLTKLQRLELARTRVTDAGLSHIRGLTEMKELRLRGTHLTDGGLAHLAELTKLELLDLSDTHVTDAGLLHLKGLTKLKQLRLNGTHVSGVGLTHLKDLTKLEILSLATRIGSDAGLAHLDAFPNLQRLDLRSGQITDAGLQHLEGVTKLETLQLSSSRITDRGLAHLNELSELRGLFLYCPQVTDAGLEHLAGLTNLGRLDLTSTKVTDAGLKHLKVLNDLRMLHLSDVQVTDAGLAHLAGLTNLGLLDLSGTRVTDAGLDHLSGLTKLRTLLLRNTDVTAEGAEKLKQALPDVRISR